jgi:hypothetical protein
MAEHVAFGEHFRSGSRLVRERGGPVDASSNDTGPGARQYDAPGPGHVIVLVLLVPRAGQAARPAFMIAHGTATRYPPASRMAEIVVPPRARSR